mmetsp:Transcript_115336/g.257696  ORF Transcript_115336/g.257696 Transcript_115336/m.257696 type:complete len:165 (-) Transcript_115336:25-519(-)
MRLSTFGFGSGLSPSSPRGLFATEGCESGEVTSMSELALRDILRPSAERLGDEGPLVEPEHCQAVVRALRQKLERFGDAVLLRLCTEDAGLTSISLALLEEDEDSLPSSTVALNANGVPDLRGELDKVLCLMELRLALACETTAPLEAPTKSAPEGKSAGTVSR